jgi:hypothetical protein
MALAAQMVLYEYKASSSHSIVPRTDKDVSVETLSDVESSTAGQVTPGAWSALLALRLGPHFCDIQSSSEVSCTTNERPRRSYIDPLHQLQW